MSEYRPTHSSQATTGIPRVVYLGILMLFAMVVAVFFLTYRMGSAQPAKDAEPAEPRLEESEPAAARLEEVDFDLQPSSFDNLPDASDLAAFSLSDLSSPQLDEAQRASIVSAVEAIEEHGAVGAVFVDAQTGRGVAYAPGTTVYGASSFKAPYALYVCEALVEPGTISLDTYCPVSYTVDSNSFYGNSGHSGYAVRELITAAVEESDNNAFGYLRDAYDGLGYDDWATSLGVTDALRRSDSWFPWYCAQSSARVWSEMLGYLDSGTNTSAWLRERLLNTNVSFIRDAIAAEGATVLNKAGWMSDADPDFCSLSDAGIIEANGHTYIMSILSGMPDSSANRALVANLVRALFDVRGSLDVQEVPAD